jgi:hypothetical protein
MSTVSLSTFSRPRFYVGMAAFMSFVVLVGFWPTYFGQVLNGIPDRPWVIHLHGLIFTGWMVLLITQVILAATGRTQAHRALGTFGIAYGFLVLAMGLVISIAAPVLHVVAGDQTMDAASGFLIIPLGDMVLFAAFFIPAVIYRRQPEIHKRLMLLATTALLFAAAGRMRDRISMPVAVLLWLSPVFLGIAYDKWTRRKVHPVYLVGLVILIIGFARIFLVESEAWLPIGRAIVRAFA